MSYNILVTTVASRVEGISVKTDIIEFGYREEAEKAIKRLPETYNVGHAVIDRRVVPINFSII